MRKSKAYKPRPINANAHLRVIQGVKPLTQEDRAYLFKQAIQALNAMQFGVNLTKSDFTVLCDMVNISLLLTEKDIGREYLPELYEAREAMQEAKQRYIKTQKLGFTAAELNAVKVALPIHQAQIEICTLGEFSDAFDEQEKRIEKGDFYKRDGDLKVAA
jgi:hypothetical protein